jgi:hypothetical protein
MTRIVGEREEMKATDTDRELAEMQIQQELVSEAPGHVLVGQSLSKGDD